MKLLIADDEHLARISLKSMIKEMEAPWNIVGEAADGEELLALVEEHKPNIAIVDIRMPKLDGLDAIRLGKERSPCTHWVILSGFSDFAYAQQAVKLGASDYLLKPVDPDELERVLLNIYKDNKDYISLMNEQFACSVFALCNNLTSLQTEQRDSLFYRGRFIGWLFALDAELPLERIAALESGFYGMLRETLPGYLAYGMHVALTALGDGQLALIAVWDPSLGPEGKRRVDEYAGFAVDAAARYGSAKAAITIVQSEPCGGFEALGEQLRDLQQWAPLRALCGIGRSLTYAELERQAAVPGAAETARSLCDIADHLKNGLYLHYQQAVNAFELSLRTYGWSGPGAEGKGAGIVPFLRAAVGLDVREDAPRAAVIEALRRHGEKMLRGQCSKESAASDLAEQVIRFVDKHYMDDIGIGQIALNLGVSVNHLSAAFQKKTGVTFVKYLTRIRMYKAKELLLGTNLQVKQIAERVGYYSTRHFTRLFTETFGSYPSDYRKMEQAKF
ncbi:response regulator transcription factor [Gordoniibacillus kamchatkensis]|uniref:response regulator transcription factor n=1 Tax=Gordoniibacillus kamchatkensis TaxID=1590651 RepID=UPI00069672F0|nr:response regulator [Paenibacillus sp. VKM B-2647]